MSKIDNYLNLTNKLFQDRVIERPHTIHLLSMGLWRSGLLDEDEIERIHFIHSEKKLAYNIEISGDKKIIFDQSIGFFYESLNEFIYENEVYNLIIEDLNLIEFSESSDNLIEIHSNILLIKMSLGLYYPKFIGYINSLAGTKVEAKNDFNKTQYQELYILCHELSHVIIDSNSEKYNLSLIDILEKDLVESSLSFQDETFFPKEIYDIDYSYNNEIKHIQNKIKSGAINLDNELMQELLCDYIAMIIYLFSIQDDVFEKDRNPNKLIVLAIQSFYNYIIMHSSDSNYDLNCIINPTSNEEKILLRSYLLRIILHSRNSYNGFLKFCNCREPTLLSTYVGNNLLSFSKKNSIFSKVRKIRSELIDKIINDSLYLCIETIQNYEMIARKFISLHNNNLPITDDDMVNFFQQWNNCFNETIHNLSSDR